MKKIQNIVGKCHEKMTRSTAAKNIFMKKTWVKKNTKNGNTFANRAKKVSKNVKNCVQNGQKMDLPWKSKNPFISVNRRDRTILTSYSDLSDIFEKNPIIKKRFKNLHFLDKKWSIFKGVFQK